MKKYIAASVLSILASVYCFFFNENELYEYIYLIPLIYGIALAFFGLMINGMETYGMSLVFYIGQVLIFIRYAVTPFFTVFSAKFTFWGWGPDPSYEVMMQAELLMCGEAVLILFVQYLAIRRFSSEKKLMKLEDKKNKVVYNENIWLLVIYAVFACTMILAVHPQMLIKDQYFMYSDSKIVWDEESLIGMYVILSDTFKKVFLIIALIICKKRYDKTGSNVYMVLAVLSVVVNMALYTGGTRIHMVFALILGVFFLNYIFGRIPTGFYIMGFVLCLISFFSVSTVKFAYALDSVEDPLRQIVVLMAGQFQDYFAGPRLVGQMIEMSRTMGENIHFSTFINDFLGSVPILANYMDQSNRINFMFNIHCNMRNQTLIAPILGIGYCYLKQFPFFLTMIFEYFVVHLDYKMRATNRLTYKYLYAFMGYICAMCMGYSTQNIYAQFVSAFIPLYVLFKINDTLIPRFSK